MCISPVWGNPSQHTRSELPTAAAATISRDDGAILRERCRRGEKVVVSMRTEVDTGWRKTPLLVAELDRPGASEDAPFVLLSGHHDTWHYGVMDNGAANATMLEAARLLARERPACRRGLRVCFWSGHSHGRYSGSAWYADEHWLELERHCAAHVNVDSTGGIGASVVTNSGVVEELAPLAADVVRAVTGQSHAGRRQARAADQSFWGIGIPSMFGSISHQPAGPVKMLTALGWWWHTPHDLIDKIDEENLVRDTRIVLGVLWQLLTDRILPFDVAAYARALLRQLDELAKQLGPRLDLGPIRREVLGLQEKAEILADHARVASTNDAPINEALMRASRALVPISYTTGDRFRHELCPAAHSLACARRHPRARGGGN